MPSGTPEMVGPSNRILVPKRTREVDEALQIQLSQSAVSRLCEGTELTPTNLQEVNLIFTFNRLDPINLRRKPYGLTRISEFEELNGFEVPPVVEVFLDLKSIARISSFGARLYDYAYRPNDDLVGMNGSEVLVHELLHVEQHFKRRDSSSVSV